MIAVVKTGGKQYKISEGEQLTVEKIEGEEGGKIILDQILMVGDGQELKIGTPLVKGANVEIKIVKQLKGKKVMTVKHKAKKRYLVRAGHRQLLTKIEVVKIKS